MTRRYMNYGRSFLCLLPLILAACHTLPTPPTMPLATGPCRTETLGVLVGRTASAVLAADALSQSGARELRWVRPKEAVTMDFREDRLNAMLDRRSRVKSFSCG